MHARLECALRAASTGSARCHAGETGTHGLQKYDGESLATRRGEEDVRGRVRLVQPLSRERVHGLDAVREARVGDGLAERRQQGTPADQRELNFVAVLLAELNDDGHEEHDLLLVRKAADMDDKMRVGVPVG